MGKLLSYSLTRTIGGEQYRLRKRRTRKADAKNDARIIRMHERKSVRVLRAGYMWGVYYKVKKRKNWGNQISRILEKTEVIEEWENEKLHDYPQSKRRCLPIRQIVFTARMEKVKHTILEVLVGKFGFWRNQNDTRRWKKRELGWNGKMAKKRKTGLRYEVMRKRGPISVRMRTFTSKPEAESFYRKHPRATHIQKYHRGVSAGITQPDVPHTVKVGKKTYRRAYVGPHTKRDAYALHKSFQKGDKLETIVKKTKRGHFVYYRSD